MVKLIRLFGVLCLVCLLAMTVISCSESNPLPDDSSEQESSDDVSQNLSILSKEYMSVSVSTVMASVTDTPRGLGEDASFKTLTYTDADHSEVLQPIVFNLTDGRKAILEIDNAKNLGAGFIIAETREMMVISQEPHLIVRSVTDPISGKTYEKEELDQIEVSESRSVYLQLLIDLNTCNVYVLYGNGPDGEEVGISSSPVNIDGSIAADDSIIILLDNGTMYRSAMQNPTYLVPLNNASFDRVSSISDVIGGYVVAENKLFDLTSSKRPQNLTSTQEVHFPADIVYKGKTYTKDFALIFNFYPSDSDAHVKIDDKYYVAVAFTVNDFLIYNDRYEDYNVTPESVHIEDGRFVIKLSDDEESSEINSLINADHVFYADIRYDSRDYLALIEYDYSDGDINGSVSDIIEIASDFGYAISSSDGVKYVEDKILFQLFGYMDYTEGDLISYVIQKDSAGVMRLIEEYKTHFASEEKDIVDSLIDSETIYDSSLYRIIGKKIYALDLSNGELSYRDDSEIAGERISLTDQYLVYNRYLSGVEVGTYLLDLENFLNDVPFMISESDVDCETLTVFDAGKFI